MEPLKEGQYEVALGESILSPSSPSSFHTFRYNFAPDSVDKTQGKYEGAPNGEATVTFASIHKGAEGHVFKGPINEGKDNDCLLIYDQETGQFTLEKLSSNVNLRNVRPAVKRSSPGKMTMEPKQIDVVKEDPSSEEDTFSDLEETLLRDLENT